MKRTQCQHAERSAYRTEKPEPPAPESESYRSRCVLLRASDVSCQPILPKHETNTKDEVENKH